MKEKKKYECQNCGWSGSRSGLYKHKKKCEIKVEEIKEEKESPDWMNFDLDESGTTETMPTPLKFLATGLGKVDPSELSPKELERFHQTNIAILKTSLGFADVGLSAYGKAVTQDKEYKVEHSDTDKEIVANAQYQWMLSRGINPSGVVGPGAAATILTGWYLGVPVYKIRKKSKKQGIVGRGLSRIPLIGRFFRKKSKQIQPLIIEEEGEKNGE